LLNTTNFTGTMGLYGPNGVLLKTASGAAASLTYATTNGGRFRVLVQSAASGGVGTYRLNVNDLVDNMRPCFPQISGTNGSLSGVGGVPGTTFVLYTQTNIAVPLASWTPLRTNQFDSLGDFQFFQLFNPAEPHRYFRVFVP
jgi:hypothetical protein